MTGTPGPFRAQIEQAGKAADARHREVEQHEVHVRMGLEPGREALEIAGLVNLGARQRAGHRLLERAEHERMIVGDENMRVIVQSLPLLAPAFCAAD